MNYLNLLDELFEDAQRNGITKYMIGKKLFGNQLTRLYQIKNPTVETLEKIKKVIEKIKENQ